jgi:hypothetical protein
MIIFKVKVIDIIVICNLPPFSSFPFFIFLSYFYFNLNTCEKIINMRNK